MWGWCAWRRSGWSRRWDEAGRPRAVRRCSERAGGSVLPRSGASPGDADQPQWSGAGAARVRPGAGRDGSGVAGRGDPRLQPRPGGADREKGFRHLHQGGAASQVFIGPFRTPAEDLIVIAVFGEDSSLGLVQVFFTEFVKE